MGPDRLNQVGWRRMNRSVLGTVRQIGSAVRLQTLQCRRGGLMGGIWLFQLWGESFMFQGVLVITQVRDGPGGGSFQ